MDYFLQVFTIAYTLTAYSSIKLYKLGQANFSHHTYLPFFPKSKFRQVLGKMGLDQYQLHIHL